MSGSDDDRQEIADRLRSLTLPELADVMRRVLPVHDGEERYGLTRRLVLAEAVMVDESLRRTFDDPAVMIEVVGWPDRDYCDGGFGPSPGLGESGSCPRCGVEVTSTAKKAYCPVCGEVCELT